MRITAHIASLKWTRARSMRSSSSKTHGKDVDYTKRAERGLREHRPSSSRPTDGYTVIGEATTSWSFVGAGLRLSAELLGPEYSMSWNTLDAGLKLFFSREVKGQRGRGSRGEAERRDGADARGGERGGGVRLRGGGPPLRARFLGKETPLLTFDDGLEVVQMLMTAYMSAEEGKTLDFPPRGLDNVRPGGGARRVAPEAAGRVSER